MQLEGEFSAKVIDRKIIWDTSKEIPFYLDPVYKPPPKPIKIPVPKIPRSILDINLESNIDLLGYYLCLNTCWKTLEVLKTKKYYYFHMTSFCWLPY